MPKKVVIVNDLHPSELPGAATISHDFARAVSNLCDAEFWFSETETSPAPPPSDLQYRIFRSSNRKLSRVASNLLYRLGSEIFDFKSLKWFYQNLRESNPDLIWIHQIGFRFPRSILLLCRLRGIRTIMTVHDFGLILPRKLFPADIGIRDDISKENLKLKWKIRRIFSTVGIKTKVLYLLRLKFLTFFHNRLTELICISEMQSKIYRGFGFRVLTTIPNGIAKCSCSNSPDRESRSILFAGRPYGKGLGPLLLSVRESDWHLYLAGNSELRFRASEVLSESQFTYLGTLSRDEIYRVIHQVSCVSVLSECFDVYPNILLEALRHGTLAVATENVGNIELVRTLDPELIFRQNSTLNLEKLELVLERHYAKNVQHKFDFDILTVEESLENYLEVFKKIC